MSIRHEILLTYNLVFLFKRLIHKAGCQLYEKSRREKEKEEERRGEKRQLPKSRYGGSQD